jgi:hypothetical protein
MAHETPEDSHQPSANRLLYLKPPRHSSIFPTSYPDTQGIPVAPDSSLESRPVSHNQGIQIQIWAFVITPHAVGELNSTLINQLCEAVFSEIVS